jgi:hypothetical protein
MTGPRGSSPAEGTPGRERVTKRSGTTPMMEAKEVIRVGRSRNRPALIAAPIMPSPCCVAAPPLGQRPIQPGREDYSPGTTGRSATLQINPNFMGGPLVLLRRGWTISEIAPLLQSALLGGLDKLINKSLRRPEICITAGVANKINCLCDLRSFQKSAG